ncbi:hypothetical protein [Caballeronia sp. LZ034LL]|uniref:hypothetical protein n=1 Tax=Caballeronia sp. LZ034LL TaxID=3038567 RepID=UPI00285B751D|nr:hypothetical protein [Caballeronia sp. LZ034LL]MDR5833368.1 hypothetical protein [Caballeronia sp. LZ034LL]
MQLESRATVPESCRILNLLAIGLIVILIMSGCTNLREENYQAFKVGSEASPTNAVGEIEVYRAEDLSSRVKEFLAHGYVVVGVTALVKRDESNDRDEITRFGKDNDANIVIMWDVPAKDSSRVIPSGLPPQFCRFAGSQCGATSMLWANRAYVYVAMAKASHDRNTEPLARQEPAMSDTALRAGRARAS